MPNLFQNLPRELPDEIVEILAQSGTVRIERIISHGQASPPDFWYDQDQAEFVIVLAGQARLQLDAETLELRPGDYLHLRAHQPHRVAWTTPAEPTIWLAIFYDEPAAG